MATMTRTTPQAPPKLTEADKKRIAFIQSAQQAYEGAFDPPLKKEDNPASWIANEATPDFNILVNRCGPVVDVGLEFLFGEPFTLTVDPKTPNAKAAQLYLDEAWGDPDDMLTLWGEIGQNGFIGGLGIAKVLPDPDTGMPGSDSPAPTFSATEPEYVTVQVDPHNRREAIGYQIRYLLSDAKTTFCQYISQMPDKANPWLIQDYESKGAGETWTLTNEEPWPYPFCPIQDCQNLTKTREYWGRSDLTPDVIGVNKGIILNASNINKIGWHMAFSWVYGAGWEGDVEPVPGRVIKFASPDAKLQALTLSNDLPALMQFLGNLRADMDEQTGVPSVATGRVAELPRGTISGIALEMLYQRLIAKTKKKRRLYGRLMRKLSQIILYFGGFDPDGDTVKLKINWPDMLPIDALQSWQAAQLQDTLDVSRHTIYAERNLDYDTERQLKQQEQADTQADYDAGVGPAPQAQAFGQQTSDGNAPMSPAVQQNQQQMPPEMMAQQAKLTGGH